MTKKIMKKFIKLNLKEIPLEEAHGGTGSRQVLVKSEHLSSEHFEAMTKGFLNPGSSYDWHEHKETDEFFIVIKGIGKFFWEKEEEIYSEGDIFIIPPNSKHKITAEGQSPSEFYFVRVK